ncbi:hypothetical protein [Erythrobacter sp. HL-111]|uniref:DUF7687 domain-containing protein n=1 Tax=Erythrobacter sp. HL-111 TaxID=1798193 RepID=UPI00087C8A49|nr:hypothetical protein [Erythrobacter sp. HL-111]SDS07366.1 hypothetical protein SAMN04515621_0907 [Erythrobacter sp. HL-111]
MRPIEKYLHKPHSFWASVRSLSQQVGYSKGDRIIVPTLRQMVNAFEALELDSSKLEKDGKPTDLALELIEYFEARSKALVEIAEPNLMTAEQAKLLFDEKFAEFSPNCPIPMNKQKGEKKAEAFLTALVNMMIEANADSFDCNYDPRELTTITRDGAPLRTLARRVDGAFPAAINPVAIWEIKEYYYTTTFGSRVADGVYETLLDGMELEELREHEDVDVRHYLMIDAHYTWWKCGKAYLCRIFDMLHMGYVDEVLFGREVVTELPRIVSEWVELARLREERENA